MLVILFFPISKITETIFKALAKHGVVRQSTLTECFRLLCYRDDNDMNFDSEYGLTVRSILKVDDQLYDVIVSSNEVLNDQTIRILFPLDYATGDAERWASADSASLINVMPNGDPFGFYTN
ncbi:unnamed protein product [Adineta ricciae]|uniref:Uncharacterized protein n=1 Tax=Adineta ricciae TaxID=249248 RepID=A0A815WD43_ADIRI|nr:unnamed protein product [Adineta ricciae]CAF1630727.1 unnamed protein product [Adineta ricciae]